MYINALLSGKIKKIKRHENITIYIKIMVTAGGGEEMYVIGLGYLEGLWTCFQFHMI